MTAKEYLQSIYYIKRKIERLEIRRKDLENDLYCFGSLSLDRENVQTSPRGDRMAEVMAKKDEVEREMVKEIKRLIQRKQDVIADIEKLSSERQKQILFDRYVLCKRWEQISAEYGKDIRWIYRIHGNALANLEKKIEMTIE